MIFNPNFILSLLLGLLLFFISTKIAKLIAKPQNKIIFLVISFILALISLSIPAAYLSDLIGANPIYAQFRTYPYTELLVILAAPFLGVINAWLADKKISSSLNRVLTGLCLTVMLLYISLPFIKPLIKPLQNNLANKWQDNVAIQTTPATCGPSSLATILKYYGKEDTEANIAKQVFTSATGTENWYLARYAHSQGFDYQFLHIEDLASVPTPAIIGVRLSNFGHFITLLNYQNGIYEIADPLTGRTLLTQEQFNHKYYYTGFVLYIKPSD